jgi:hypothetical protein
MKKRILFLAIVFTSLLLSSFVFAQVPETTQWIGIRATDAAGKPAANLTPEALTLTINKQQAKITEVVPESHRQYVVLIDLAFSSMDGINASRQAAWNFLSSLDRDSVAAIAVYDLQNGVRLQCSFTSDKNQWIYALNRLEQKMDNHDAAGFYFPADAHQSSNESFLEFSTVQPALNKVAGLPEKMKADKAADQFASKLTEFAKALSIVRGEKEVLLFSPGVPSRKAVNEMQTEEDRDLGGMTVPDTSGEVTELQQSAPVRKQSAQAADALADAFLTSNAAVYTFDLSKIGKPAASGQDFLKAVAKRTGGTFFDDIQGLQQLKTMPAANWLVSWRETVPPELVREVKVGSGSGIKIQAPSRLMAPTSVLKSNDIEKKLYFSQWLYNDIASGSLKHAEFVDFFPLEKQLEKTIFFLQVPGDQLLQTKSKMRSFYIYGYVMKPDGQLVDYIFTPIRVDTEKTSAALKKAGLRYFDTFLTPPGDYRFCGVFIDIENSEANAFGFPFQVPDFQDLSVTRPIIASTEPDWIALRHEYSDEKKRSVDASYPYEGKQGIFFPELTPALHNGNTYFLYYCVYNLSLDTTRQPPQPLPQFQFSLKPDVAGERTPIGQIALAERNPISDKDWELLFEFKMPQVATGSYSLVTEVIDGVAKKKTSRQVPVTVR